MEKYEKHVSIGLKYSFIRNKVLPTSGSLLISTFINITVSTISLHVVLSYIKLALKYATCKTPVVAAALVEQRENLAAKSAVRKCINKYYLPTSVFLQKRFKKKFIRNDLVSYSTHSQDTSNPRILK